jgi:nucleotide-binding universal stress UspA family protein
MGDHRIVVGVDGSPGGRRALNWALHEAATRGAAVAAVMSWRWDVSEPAGSGGTGSEPAGSGGTGSEPAMQEAERVLREEIAAQVAAVPQSAAVTIAAEVVEGRAAPVLVEAAREADMLVLGSHGHDRVYRTVLGSTAQECVESAQCPVVIIPTAWAVPDAQPGEVGR